jgi:hypothetical protein
LLRGNGGPICIQVTGAHSLLSENRKTASIVKVYKLANTKRKGEKRKERSRSGL